MYDSNKYVHISYIYNKKGEKKAIMKQNIMKGVDGGPLVHTGVSVSPE